MTQGIRSHGLGAGLGRARSEPRQRPHTHSAKLVRGRCHSAWWHLTDVCETHSWPRQQGQQGQRPGSVRARATSPRTPSLQALFPLHATVATATVQDREDELVPWSRPHHGVSACCAVTACAVPGSMLADFKQCPTISVHIRRTWKRRNFSGSRLLHRAFPSRADTLSRPCSATGMSEDRNGGWNLQRSPYPKS